MKIRYIPKFLTGGTTVPWYLGKFNPYNEYDYITIPDWVLYDTSKLYAGDLSNGPTDAWVSNLPSRIMGRYTPTTHLNHYNYTKGVEGNQYYKDFTDALVVYDSETGKYKFTPTGEAWAKAVDERLPKNSPSRFYDENNNLRDSWYIHKSNDIHGRPGRHNGTLVYNNLRDYVNWLRNDQILGARHNIFIKRGDRYYYRDADGKKVYVNPNEKEGYLIKDLLQNDTNLWDNSHKIMWNDYELIAPSQETNPPTEPTLPTQPETPPNAPPSATNPYRIRGRKVDIDNIPGFWANLGTNIKKNLPNLLGLADLTGSIISNEKIFNEQLKGIRPSLMLPYLTHRLVVGDEATKLAYYRRGIQGLTKAARPFTSDADRQMAYQMEAKRAADELKAQGDLADNQEIRRTSDESNQHQWANTQRLAEVANTNTRELNQVAAAKHNLLAQKHAANWTSFSNYLKELQVRNNQQKARIEAILDQMFTLDQSLRLLQDAEYLKAYKEYYNALAEHEYDSNDPTVKEKYEKYRAELLRIKRLNLLSQLDYISSHRFGGKTVYKKDDTLLYKATRDAVKHFREMSKASTNAMIKSRGKKEKLVPHPKTPKYQTGGMAPFVVYTPAPLGGTTSYESYLSDSAGRETGKEKGVDKEKETLDLIKNMFKEFAGGKGLPIDADIIYKQFLGLLAQEDALGTGLSTSDILSLYLKAMNMFNKAMYSKSIYDLALKQATENGALNEYAVTLDGRYVVLDIENGGIKYATMQDINESEGKLNPLKNAQLLDLRAYSKNLAFRNGDLFMQIVGNGVGLPNIAKYIKDIAVQIGSSETKIDGVSGQESSQIKQGISAILGSDGKTITDKNQKVQAELALRYLVGVLPENMKAVLNIEAKLSGVSPQELITSFIGSQLSTTHKEESGSSGSGESGKFGNMSPVIAFAQGMGERNQFIIADKTLDGLKINTVSIPLLDKENNPIANATLQLIGNGPLNGQLRLDNVTMGGLAISPTGLNQVLISNGEVHSAELPIDMEAAKHGIIKPDFSFLKEIELANKELLEMGITDKSTNVEAVNKVYLKHRLPIIYDSKNGKPVLTSRYKRFALFKGTATETAFEDEDLRFNDGVEEVDDSREKDRFESTMRIVTGDLKYELKRGWFGGTDLFTGTIFIPMKDSMISALASTGYKGTPSLYNLIDTLDLYSSFIREKGLRILGNNNWNK